MRAFKTVLAIFITVAISIFLKREYYVFGLIGACITMGTSVSDSFEDATKRVLGTILGASIGLIATYFRPDINSLYNPFIISIGSAIIIYICNIFNMHKIIPMSCVVFFSVILNNSNSAPMIYAINRVIDTSIGVGVAILVNIFFFPPNKYKNIKLDQEKFFNLARQAIYKIDANEPISDELDKIERIYHHMVSFILIEENEIKIHGKAHIKETDIYEKKILFRDFLESLRDINKVNIEMESLKFLIDEEDKFIESDKYDDTERLKSELLDLKVVLDYHIKRVRYDFAVLENFNL